MGVGALDVDAVATNSPDLVRLSSEVVSAYVCRNAVPVAAVPELISTVHAALLSLGKPVLAEHVETTKPSSAEIKRSITSEGLRSFIDGRSYQTLKRHLGRHGLTPAEYRARFGLPADYPMVSSAYTAKRSALAKSLGLGSFRKKASKKDEVAASPAPNDAVAPAEPKRSRRPKAAAKTTSTRPA